MCTSTHKVKQFGCIYKKFGGYKMSILDKLRTKSQPTPQEEVETEVKITNINLKESDLSLDEITFLLTAIKDSTFKVSDVELVYNTIIKLQTQFLALSTKPKKGK